MRHIQITPETFALHSSFAISRSAKMEIDVVVVAITEGGVTGHGECRPYARYGESVESVTAQIRLIENDLKNGLTRQDLLMRLPAGAARNAVDCALWRLEAAQKNISLWGLMGGQGDIKPVTISQTLSLDTPEKMAQSALHHSKYKTLKLKLSGDNKDIERIKAVHKARPDAALVIDANEGWSMSQLTDFVARAPDYNVTMIEQPLPKDEDYALKGFNANGIDICGDESIHTLDDIIEKQDLYSMMNIKLGKSGGLTHALEMVEGIKQLNQKGKNIKTMIGCMVSSSMAITPALLLAQNCALADLDGAWWLSDDREEGLIYKDGLVSMR